MNSTQLHTVTLTDLATYRLVVAADTPNEAQRIAQTVLFEEMTHLPPGTEIVKRETKAVAEVASDQPIRRYRVQGQFELAFVMVVPAATPDEAERHARRLYDENCGPFEFDHDGGQLTRLTAREVTP